METEQQWRKWRRDFEAWLRLEKGLAGNSVAAYLTDYDHLARYMTYQALAPEDVTLDHLQQLLNTVDSLEIAPTTQRRMIAGWRTFFKMLVIDDILKDNPAELLDLPTRPKHLPDVLTDEEITKIQSTIDLSLPEGMRNYVIIEVLYD